MHALCLQVCTVHSQASKQALTHSPTHPPTHSCSLARLLAKRSILCILCCIASVPSLSKMYICMEKRKCSCTYGCMYACLQCLLRKDTLLQVESYFFDIRRQLFEYDQVMNTQRDKVHTHTLTRLAFIITVRVTCTQSMPYMPDACCRGPSQLVLVTCEHAIRSTVTATCQRSLTGHDLLPSCLQQWRRQKEALVWQCATFGDLMGKCRTSSSTAYAAMR